MRFRSSISFAWLLVLFFELVAMPFYVNAKPVEQVVSVLKDEPCCAKKSAGSACSRSSGAANEGPECCVNCPLFQIMMLPHLALPVKSASLIERTYAAYQASYLFIYCPSAWKPPNGC